MREPHWAVRTLRDLLCGALIGAGAILPGVSGGVLAVVFGIYRPFMEVLTHPAKALPKYWRWIPALGIGWAAGFLGFAKGITLALELSASVTVWLFIGLIVGTLPALFRQAGREGRPRSAWVSMALCFSAMLLGMLALRDGVHTQVEPGFWWYGFCGALWGLSVVIPGMTSSPVLMALGLYQPLMDGLAAMRWDILTAALPGMLLTIAALARLISWFFRRHYPLAFHGILGVMLASTLAIVPTAYRGGWEIALSAACCAAGFACAALLGRLDRRLSRPET